MVGDSSASIVGAGLVGSLLAILLGQQGFMIEVFERRADLREAMGGTGRSINLAVSTRALHALRLVGMEEEIKRRSVPMQGRMIHLVDGRLVYQPYSESKVESLYSISRGELNKILMDEAERTGNVQIHFNHKAQDIDFEAGILYLHNEKEAKSSYRKSSIVLGCDGSGSGVRRAMDGFLGCESIEEPHPYGYKELTIPAGPEKTFLMEKNALHLWPRETCMLLATANHNGSFTCTLFLPLKGKNSFEELKTPEEVEVFFEHHFPDAFLLIHNLTEAFFSNPIGTMSTVKTEFWHVEDKVLLLGDAAHGIVPFFGQGMNAGFEDCVAFEACLQKSRVNGDGVNWKDVFLNFFQLRKENADAIANMALENFFEIHNKVSSVQFMMEKEVEGILEKCFPNQYFSRYTLVAFTLVPYKVAMSIGVLNQEILTELCMNITDISQLDLVHAKRLIHDKLTPLLKQYKKELLLE